MWTTEEIAEYDAWCAWAEANRPQPGDVLVYIGPNDDFDLLAELGLKEG